MKITKSLTNTGVPPMITYNEPIFGAEVIARPGKDSREMNEAIARLPHWADAFDRLSKWASKYNLDKPLF
jgi:hypothetical protein